MAYDGEDAARLWSRRLQRRAARRRSAGDPARRRSSCSATRLALVSSFGAESAVLLHMAAADRAGHPGAVPRHRHAVRPDPGLSPAAGRRLGLTDVRDLRPQFEDLAIARSRRRPLEDRHRRLLPHPQGAAARPRAGRLRRLDHRPQALPGRRPAAPAGGRTGRRQDQVQPAGQLDARPSSTPTPPSTTCPPIRWWPFGYPSIGCWPCTAPVEEGEDTRAGRWAGSQKTECGIHIARAPGDARSRRRHLMPPRRLPITLDRVDARDATTAAAPAKARGAFYVERVTWRAPLDAVSCSRCRPRAIPACASSAASS